LIQSLIFQVQGNSEIFVMGVDGELDQLTDAPADDLSPTGLPTEKLVFQSNRNGNYEIYVMKLR